MRRVGSSVPDNSLEPLDESVDGSLLLHRRDVLAAVFHSSILPQHPLRSPVRARPRRQSPVGKKAKSAPHLPFQAGTVRKTPLSHWGLAKGPPPSPAAHLTSSSFVGQGLSSSDQLSQPTPQPVLPAIYTHSTARPWAAFTVNRPWILFVEYVPYLVLTPPSMYTPDWSKAISKILFRDGDIRHGLRFVA